jgi:hypothetical protein
MTLWEWNGRNWAQTSLSNSPDARNFQGMVRDRERGNVAFFGGSYSRLLFPAQFGMVVAECEVAKLQTRTRRVAHQDGVCPNGDATGRSGKLNLDTPIKDDLDKPLPSYGSDPAFPDKYGPYKDLADDARWEKITPRMCLTHSTGFSNFCRRWME